MNGLWQRLFGTHRDMSREAVLAETDSVLQAAKRVALNSIVDNEEQVKQVTQALRREEVALISLADDVLGAFKRDRA